MSFFGDIGSDIKNSFNESVNSAKQTIKENINTQLNAALSNTRRTAIKRPKRGYYSGIEAYGVMHRNLQLEQNYYINDMNYAYAVPVLGCDKNDSVPRFDIRSLPYATEYSEIESEFEIQNGIKIMSVDADTTTEEDSGPNGDGGKFHNQNMYAGPDGVA